MRGAIANQAKKQRKNATHVVWNARIWGIEKFRSLIRVALPLESIPGLLSDAQTTSVHLGIRCLVPFPSRTPLSADRPTVACETCRHRGGGAYTHRAFYVPFLFFTTR